LQAGADETALYALAVDVLIDLHRRPAAETLPDDLPLYDAGRLLEEASLLTDWFLPATRSEPTPRPVRDAYVAAWREAFTALEGQPATLVLRDFHVDNLVHLPDRPGVRACGLLDFQDAVAGSPAYDLMSLVEDARRDITPALKAAMIERYVAAMPGLHRRAFDAAFAVLAAQRHAKVIGIFTRLHRRDGKATYLAHIPRVWGLLEDALAHPALDAVARWFDQHVPATARGMPPCETVAS